MGGEPFWTISCGRVSILGDDKLWRALEKFLVQFRSALFAIVVIIVELLFRFESHAETVLPNFACLTLNHELSRVRIVLFVYVDRVSSRNTRPQEVEIRTSAPAHATRNTLFLVLG